MSYQKSVSKSFLKPLNNTVSNPYLEDFDDEISGINLSKLFSVYGPNNVNNISRKNTTGNDKRSKLLQNKALTGGRNTTMQRTVFDKYQKDNEINQGIENDSLIENNKYKAKSLIEMSQPIVIKLVTNLFT